MSERASPTSITSVTPETKDEFIKPAVEQLLALCNTDDDGKKNGAQLWKFETERNGVRMFTRKDSSSPFVQSKGIMHMKGTAEQFEDLASDFVKFSAVADPEWSRGVPLEELGDPKSVVAYRTIKMPFGITDRDMLWMSHVCRGPNNELVITGKDCSHPSKEAESKLIRGHILACGYVVNPHPDGGIRVEYVIQFDPQGWIPSAFVNMKSTEQLGNMGKIADYLDKLNEQK